METETTTDLGQLQALLKRWGVEFSMSFNHHKDFLVLVLKAKEHARVDGYPYFEAAFSFTWDGSFEGIDIYE